MDVKEICPCVNLECPNHGNCEKCTSRHLNKGFLNFCGFHTILPLLQEAIDASPDIGNITVQQALAGWCEASLEQTP